MRPRTKIALAQNTVVGVPVIIGEALFSGLPLTGVQHVLLAACGGYAISLVGVYATLRGFVERWIRRAP
jgi:hypothetical protein